MATFSYNGSSKRNTFNIGRSEFINVNEFIPFHLLRKLPSGHLPSELHYSENRANTGTYPARGTYRLGKYYPSTLYTLTHRAEVAQTKGEGLGCVSSKERKTRRRRTQPQASPVCERTHARSRWWTRLEQRWAKYACPGYPWKWTP